MQFTVGEFVRCGFGFANPNHAAVVYDRRGQLLVVKDADGNDVERYAYDKAGNMVKKVVRGSRFVVRDGVETLVRDGEYKTTTFTFDDANQLVSSTTDGVTTRYEYDAAGRLVREGDKTYTYGYLDKVMSVRFDRSSANSSTSQPLNSSTVYTYTYHPDGQLASANYGDSSEDFTWDGLALVQRGDEHFINEPHVGGGNPVASSKGTSFFNDALGTTVGAKSGKQYSAATLTAFGEDLTVNAAGDSSHSPFPVPHSPFFTGKPHVAGLGHAFLMRNYRAGLGKWQTADPLGYPDGWNQLAYCGNGVTGAVDLWGCKTKPHDPHLVGVVEVVWSDSTYKELTYGVDIYGQCNGGKIRDQKVTHSGSIAPGFTVSAALVESIIKLLPGNFQSSEIGLVVFTQLFWEEVPFSRKENKDGKDPYLEFEIMLQCVVTLYEKGDEETKKVPMPFTITLKKQLVHFNCEE